MTWFTIGISGITCGGKTTLATKFYNYLSDENTPKQFGNIRINRVVLIQQDKYFWPRDNPKHIWIDEINFINREVMSAMDMDQMWADVEEVLTPQANSVTAVDQQNNSPVSNGALINLNILIIEGFLIFNYDPIYDLCQIKYHFQLPYDLCLQRRLKRNFKHVNPQPEKYFAEFIWPSYRKHLDELKNSKEIIYLNGEHNKEEIFKLAFHYFIEAALRANA